MFEDDSKLIETLRNTQRCRPQVQKAAEDWAQVASSRIESIARKLIGTGEDKALGILLNVCAINKVELDPALLADTLRVVDDIVDFAFPFGLQDKKAIGPLLQIAQAKDISWERQAFAGHIAAELAVRLDHDQKAVRKVLLKLSHEITAPEVHWMLDDGLHILESGDTKTSLFPSLSQKDVLDELPAERPPVVIGGDYSVRRPVSKISRNAPCPCGSGKKYKKCCYDKDQQLLLDASPYEGLTRTQVEASPSLVDDAAFIHDMRAYQLKKLISSELNEKQLLAAYERADTFGLYEMAFSMLKELRGRPGQEEFAVGHMADLLDSTLDSNELEIARRIEKEIPDNELFFKDIDLRFYLLEKAQYFAKLENRCRQILCEPGKSGNEFVLSELTYDFERLFPALCVVFGRSAIASFPERTFENDMLLECIQGARIELGLDPWGDPIEEYYEWSLTKEESDLDHTKKDKEIEKLKKQAIEAQRSAIQKKNELKEKEQEIDKLLKKLEKTESQLPGQQEMTHEGSKKQADLEESLHHLRRRVKNLKEEISLQKQARTELRHQLLEAEKKSSPAKSAQDETRQRPEEGLPVPDDDVRGKILVPEYADQFRRSCESMAPGVVAKALRSAAGFAAYDKSVWRQTRQIETLDSIYRIRIGLQNRLLLLWEPGIQLKILDLIPRQSLETWIKQHQT